MQVIDTVGAMIGLPIEIQRIILYALVAGFPIAIILAWALELTPEGVRRDSGTEHPDPVTARRTDKIIIILLALAVAYFLGEKALRDGLVDEQDIDRSVAIVPFANLSNDVSTDPFTRGIHEDILTRLARIKSIRTISRTTMSQYRDTAKTASAIGSELDVATILAGGVQRSGDRVRINVQLIDAANDEPLWAESYDRQLTAENVFDIQSDISRMITGELQATLTPEDISRIERRPTNSIAALDSYFVGKQLLEQRTSESLLAAVEHFEGVVEIDPDFALAWSGLADAYMLLPEYSPDFDRNIVTERSTAAVARALELDPDLPYVSSSLAWSQLIHDYDWAGAEETFKRALEIEPDNTNVLHWYSHTLSWQGRHEEAIQTARLALSVEPFSKLMSMNMTYILVDAGRYEEGLQNAVELREREPNYMSLRRNYFFHELRAGQIEAGAESFVFYTRLIGGDVEAARTIGDMMIAYANDGVVGNMTAELISRARLGNEDLAQIYAFIGDRENTLASLRVAIDERAGSRSVLSMKINPAYDFVRDDPRFISMLAEVGLAD